MTFSTKPKESPSVANEIRGRLFSASSRPYSSSSAKRALGLADEKKYSDLSSTESLTHVRNSRCVQITDHKGEVTHVVSSNRNHNFKNDRILLVTNKVPFYLFSNIPFSKNNKNSGRIELRKDGARRRNTSGPRPLSAINDTAFDAFDLLGIEKGENGQELSYGHLLIPSRQHHKEKKNPFSMPVEPNVELTSANVLRNYGIARCYTYDHHYANNRNLSTSPSAFTSSDTKQQIDDQPDGSDSKFNMVCVH